MFHKETNPYFIQAPHPPDGEPQSHSQPQHPNQDPQQFPHRQDLHPRFSLPEQPPHPENEDQHPQQITLPRPPQAQHSFQVPLQQGKQQKKKPKDKKTEHAPLPHIYVPHDIIHQEPPQHRPRQHPHPTPQGLRVPHPRKTRPATWFVAVFCAILWFIIFLGGLIILFIYLIYRPHSPKYELSEMALNAAYLDMGRLLNADVRLLVNFTNINKKVKVDFQDMVMNLYYGRTLIATNYIKPFSERRHEHVLLDVHLMSSQVQLSLEDSQRLARQLDGNRVVFRVMGFFRTRYDLGSWLKYRYTLHSDCRVVVSGPPNGVLVAKNCRTKR